VEKGRILRLLVVEESENDAEVLSSALRNAGHAVRLSYVGDPDALETAIGEQEPDIALFGAGVDTFTVADLCSALDKRTMGTPVIALGENADEAAVIEALRSGCTALVSYDRPDHLQLVVEKEIAIHRLRQDLQRQADSLQECEARYRALVNSSRDAIACIHDGMHIYANKSYLEMFGFSSGEDIDGTPILDLVDPEEHDRLKQILRGHGRAADGDTRVNISTLDRDGNIVEKTMEFAPASIDGEPCTQIIIREDSPAAMLEQQYRSASEQDPLTGLYNSQYFNGVLEAVIGDRTRDANGCAVLYLLVDNVKVIRDNAGIAGCDAVLRDVADIIRAQVAESDTVARFGGHTLTILSRHRNEEEIREFSTSILRSVEAHITETDNRTVTTTCSIGVSFITANTHTADEVLSRADLACEVARSSGGNQLHIHEAAIENQLDPEHEKHWDQIIKCAIDENRLRLVYQPIVSLCGQEGERYEVLFRILDENGTLILPSQFFTMVEKTGRSVEVDRWIIEHAVRMLAEQIGAGRNVTLFIKISANALADEELLLWVGEQLRERGVRSESIVLEIAENIATRNLKNTRAFITAARALRCRTALEHFGCMSNPHQLMMHLPVDIIKIDGSIIRDLASDGECRDRFNSIVETAHERKMQCIAERVDDARNLAVLWRSDIDFIQGYFVQEPSEALSYDFHGEIA
jgi:diguanylate cyclase (GGDEF)-like protein/PAS domain S-box-containing protein